MKYILAVLCGLMVLFMGGCVVLTLNVMPFPVIPGFVAFLNLAVLAVMFGWKNLQWRPAFYILGVADLLLALAAGWMAATIGGGSETGLIWIVAILFLVKGVASLAYARNLGKQPESVK